MNEGIGLEKGQKDSISYNDIQAELDEKGFFVLEKGTKFDLELGYTPLGGEYEQGESLVAHERRDVVSHLDLELEKDLEVGEIVAYQRGQDGEKNLYIFTLTSPDMVEFLEKSKEFERTLISRFNIPEDCFETPYPEGLGDIDMSLFKHYHPHAANLLQEKSEKDPHCEKVVSERKHLNKEFVKQYIGNDAITEKLESVRIVVRM